MIDQSIPKNENNYYETRIGDAIDEPAPVNPIPDRKHELLGDQTIDIEEYLMTEQQRDLNELDTAEETFKEIDAEEAEMTAAEADEIEEGLKRDEAAEDEVNERGN